MSVLTERIDHAPAQLIEYALKHGVEALDRPKSSRKRHRARLAACCERGTQQWRARSRSATGRLVRAPAAAVIFTRGPRPRPPQPGPAPHRRRPIARAPSPACGLIDQNEVGAETAAPSMLRNP